MLEAIDCEAVQSEGYAFQIEFKYRAYHAGFRLVEAPIVFVDRRIGSSKMSTRIVLEAVLRTWPWPVRPLSEADSTTAPLILIPDNQCLIPILWQQFPVSLSQPVHSG